MVNRLEGASEALKPSLKMGNVCGTNDQITESRRENIGTTLCVNALASRE